MINQERLQEVLTDYKKEFPVRWKNESFKWQAVQWFQDHWDIDAPDFSAMLSDALRKKVNLLAGGMDFSFTNIKNQAQQNPAEVKMMFADLFDESKDVYQRVADFIEAADAFPQQPKSTKKKHNQSNKAVSIYLWLRYPDKYYIYAFTAIKAVVKTLEASDYFIENEDYLLKFGDLYDEIREVLKKDEELVQLFQSTLQETKDCYADPELKTLTLDVCFFIKQRYGN